MDIYTASILISIVVYAIVGNYAGRKVKDLEDYFVVGRQAPTVLIVGTLVASVLSTNAFLGETGFSYDTQGGAFIVWPAIWLTGYVYGVLFFGRYLRRSRALTVAEFFGRRFEAPRVQVAAGVTIVLGLGFLAGTAYEWYGLIYEEGLTISTNLFGTTFYSLVGFHAFHVIVGLMMLSLVFTLGMLGFVASQHGERVEILSWYWHFVDAVWVVVLTTVYIVGLL